MFEIYDITNRIYKKGIYEITYELTDSNLKLKKLIKSDKLFTLKELISFLEITIQKFDPKNNLTTLKKKDYDQFEKRIF